MRSTYWTCTPFADWLRGTDKLQAGTSEEWDEWEARAKKDFPIRWWLAEEGLDYIQKFVYYIPDKLNNVRYYINNRWVSRSNALTAHPRDIKPGNWQDVGHRFLPCLFNELVNFIEVEKAWMNVLWDEEKRDKYSPPWWRTGWLRWRTWRCPEAGLDYLNWEMSLKHNEDYVDKNDPNYNKPTSQALAAKEQYELYKWWTEVYPNRPDPHEASGWSEYCRISREENGGKLSFSKSKNKKTKALGDKALKQLHKIEAAYEKENDQMLMRLIKIRHSLWT